VIGQDQKVQSIIAVLTREFKSRQVAQRQKTM